MNILINILWKDSCINLNGNTTNANLARLIKNEKTLGTIFNWYIYEINRINTVNNVITATPPKYTPKENIVKKIPKIAYLITYPLLSLISSVGRGSTFDYWNLTLGVLSHETIIKVAKLNET